MKRKAKAKGRTSAKGSEEGRSGGTAPDQSGQRSRATRSRKEVRQTARVRAPRDTTQGP